MNSPLRLHRYEIPLNEAVECLLGGAVQDAARWELRVAGDMVTIDIVEPSEIEPPSGEKIRETMDGTMESAPVTGQSTVGAGSPLNEAAKSNVAPQREPEPEPMKGGPLARRATLLCTKRAFLTFVEASDADQATDYIRRECHVASRRALDHFPQAAKRFEAIEMRFSLWQQGYDV